MIDFVQGEYLLAEMTNFPAYLEAIGTCPSKLVQILTNPVRVEIMNPTNPYSSEPGYWCFNEDFGGFQTNFVIDQSSEEIGIEESIGSELITTNRFHWRQSNKLAQYKISDDYACIIIREFEEDGFKMVLFETTSAKKAYLKFQRL